MRPVSELTLYKYRHLIGYGCLVLLTVGLLVLRLDSIPNGLSGSEEASALASSRIVFDQHFLDTVNTVDLPYHLMQRVSLHFFGLSPLGVRLPSLIVGALGMLFLMMILRRWLQENVAIAWGILVATSTWFLVLGRSGTPDIMVVFWTSLILLLATLVSQQARGYPTWKALSLVCVALSFYTPLMAYLFAASLLAAAFQPHLRYVIRYAGRASVTLGGLLFVVMLVPLAWSIWLNPDIARQLLAIPLALPGPLAFFKNLWDAASALVNPLRPSIGTFITPLLSLPVAALAIVGLVRTVTDSYSVRGYVLLLWLAVLVPVVGLNPTRLNVVFVPVILLGAIGMQSLFRYWYDLFPRNPYARIFGLLPILLLLAAIVMFNYQTYFTGVVYAKSSAGLYSADPVLLSDALGSKLYRDQRIVLIATPQEAPLYHIDTAIAPNLQVVTPAQFVSAPAENEIIVSTNAAPLLTPDQLRQLPPLQNMLLSDRKDNALRFQIYAR